MRSVRPGRVSVVGVAVVGVVAAAIAGCSGEEVRSRVDAGAKQAAEAVARNVAAQAGAQAFAQKGVTLDGGLECEATGDAQVERVTIKCSGRSTQGRPVTMDGEAMRPTAEARDVQGKFVGKAGQREVFSTNCLGTGC